MNFKQLIQKYLQSTLMLNPLPFITELDLNINIKFRDFEKKSPVTRPHLMSAMVTFEIRSSYIVKLSYWQPLLSSKSNVLNTNRTPKPENPLYT